MDKSEMLNLTNKTFKHLQKSSMIRNIMSTDNQCEDKEMINDLG